MYQCELRSISNFRFLGLLFRNHGYSFSGRTAGDGQQDVRPQAYHDDPDLCENHQRQDRQGYGYADREDSGQVQNGSINFSPNIFYKRVLPECIYAEESELCDFN